MWVCTVMDCSVCPICQYEIEFFAIGVCNHPICLRCAVKLRRFGSPEDADRNCPTCRTKNPSVRMSYSAFNQNIE